MSGDACNRRDGRLGASAAGRSEQDQTPYLDALVEYAERDPGRFHVPGPQGGPGADPRLIEALGAAAFDHDIPAGIEGIDVGPDPTRSSRLSGSPPRPGARGGAGS